MSATTERFDAAVRARVARGLEAMEVVHTLVAGRLERDTLRRHAARYYAELRTFIDVKLPERLRLCPYGAVRAKEFFARAYVEEQGRFVPDRDHASLFRRLCDALDVAPTLLETETRTYAQRFRYLRELEPSPAAMVRELAITYAWESAAPLWADALAGALHAHYGVPEGALEFFALHHEIDRVHAAEAFDVLACAADAPPLQELALATVTETLDLRRYFGPP